MPKKLSNCIMLITYADSLGINLKELAAVLEDCVKDAIGGIHILPFYPSSADKGFAPLNYEVDSAFGSWEDIENLAEKYYLSVDYEVNQLSAHSPEFLDVLKNGKNSPYDGFFLRPSDVWPEGKNRAADLERIANRREGGPIQKIARADGSMEEVWSTFGGEMIDLNVQDPGVRAFHRGNLRKLSEHGASVIRLDALGYAVKKAGTDCYFVEPEIWNLLAEYAGDLKDTGTEILPDVHGSYFNQIRLSERGYRTCGSALPLLVLQALYFGDALYLRNWMKMCPRNQFTVLDTHDGIGIGDVRHLLPDAELERTLQKLYAVSPVTEEMRADKGTYYAVHQVNCTFYSALGEDDQKYLCARAIQFFTPGIPAVYYMGLLAATNDYDLLGRTRKPRDINRSYFLAEQAERELQKPVVRRLLRLMQFRNSTPAFNGNFTVEDSNPWTIDCQWTSGISTASLHADLRTGEFTVESSDGGERKILDLTLPEEAQQQS